MESEEIYRARRQGSTVPWPTSEDIGKILVVGDNGDYELTEWSQLDFSSLPSNDPHQLGRLWSNAGVLTISAG